MAGKVNYESNRETIRQVFRAEQDARKRIAAANKAARDAEKESQRRVTQIRDEFRTQSEVEQARQSNRVEEIKLKGYETQRQARNEGNKRLLEQNLLNEKLIDSTRSRYEDELKKTQKLGEQKLLQEMNSQQLQAQRQKNKSENDIKAAQAEHQFKVEEAQV